MSEWSTYLVIRLVGCLIQIFLVHFHHQRFKILNFKDVFVSSDFLASTRFFNYTYYVLQFLLNRALQSQHLRIVYPKAHSDFSQDGIVFVVNEKVLLNFAVALSQVA